MPPFRDRSLSLLPVALFLIATLSPPPTGAAPVRIQGLEAVSPEDAESWIESQLEFVESDGVSMPRADDLAFFLENALRDRGFARATVDWKLVDGGTVILLTVNEGNPQRIAAIEVRGNRAVETAAIEELLLSATRKRLRLGPDAPVPYVVADIQSGREKVIDLYREIGFSDVILTLEHETSPDGIRLEATLDEGARHVIGNVLLPAPADPEMESDFHALATDLAGKSYRPAHPAIVRTRLREIAIDAGYYNAEIQVTPVAAKRVEDSPMPVIRGIGGKAKKGPPEPVTAPAVIPIDLAVTIDWGEAVIIDRVVVRGNEGVTDRFFERHFEGIAGSPYSPNDTNREVEELLRTGAFETVRTDLVQHPDGTATLEVEVEESEPYSLGIYGGYANYEGPIGGFEFQNLNVFGSVRELDAAIEFSRRGARGEVELFDPWFLWSEYELRTGIFAVNREEEGYEQLSTGGRYHLSRKIGRRQRNRISLFGEAAYTDVHEAEIADRFLGDREYFANMAGISVAADHRDQRVNPRSGWILQGSASVASSVIGSEVEYFKGTGALAFYRPFGDLTFRFRARGGIIEPIGDSTIVPIDLRFFNGGPNSVRSFEERRLGPVDPGSGYPVGGEFFTVISAEFDIPVAPVSGLSVVPFFDAGNLLPDAGDAGFNAMRYAAGIGLHYLTPIGPLRIEYGHTLDRQAGDPEGTLHLGFGSGL